MDGMRIEGEVDGEGRIILPPEVLKRYGMEPGTRFSLEERSDALTLRRPTGNLSKVYIEPTNACNLQCRTCMRNSWHESPGWMSEGTFDRIVEGLKNFSPVPSVFFGGFGEPLSHPRITDMIAAVKALGARVEIITNGTLLTPMMSGRLVEAGLDGIWISLDSADAESYADVRPGAGLPEVIANARTFRDVCSPEGHRYPENVSIGVVFVAMKRNIADLAGVVLLGEQFGATRFLVTNVLPYHRDMSEEVLYSCSLSHTGAPSPLFRVILPMLDRNEVNTGAIRDIADLYEIAWPSTSHAESANRCPFVRTGATAINWEGNVSPCLPLMHDTESYVDRRERFSRRYAVGNLSDTPLKELWNTPDYVAFRERVQVFDFPPCSHCGCQLSERNEEDCFGNPFPTCGGCLWAQGIIQCP